ncbi:UDP-N-acetylglucosamine 2-epimerase [Achromobacter animicus]|uniref:UDP-N-acetylglucosamine 2-epimerase n=1 Tax=Achromobacter animicus TaxID=1389935 RepID=UPI0028AAA12C|nr:UDP-N-acetylglucosamine 2-epimerase [Achromobacter animicus]
MKILGFTSIRSDYDLMSTFYRLLNEDPGVDLRLLVSGAHLSPEKGMTVRDIRIDGFSILAEIETLISGDSSASRLKTASNLLSGGLDVVKAFAPDLIVYAGDREDVLIAAMIGGFLGVPTAHFFAGDHAVDGHIDNPVRHAASKLSSLCFASVEEHRHRLVAIGESSSRIHVIGSVALDKFVDEPAMDFDEVRKSIGPKNAGLHKKAALFIFHPIADEISRADEFILNGVQALIDRGFHVYIGSPNTDPGNSHVEAAIRRLGLLPDVTVYGSIERALFINLFRHVDIIVGNSSAGILESPTLRIPAINIGQRQRGRLCASNVIFCEGERASIEAALERALSEDFQASLEGLANPYGDGKSARKAYDIIRSLDLTTLAVKWEDPLQVGDCHE